MTTAPSHPEIPGCHGPGRARWEMLADFWATQTLADIEDAESARADRAELREGRLHVRWIDLTGLSCAITPLRPWYSPTVYAWTDDAMRTLGSCVRHALDQRTAYAALTALTDRRGGEPLHQCADDLPGLVAALLIDLTQTIAGQANTDDTPVPLTGPLRWTRVAASAAHASQIDDLLNLARPAEGLGADTITGIHRWETGAPGGLAPLAWLAGLTPIEAAAAHAHGELTITGLETLITLRGQHLPPTMLPPTMLPPTMLPPTMLPATMLPATEAGA